MPIGVYIRSKTIIEDRLRTGLAAGHIADFTDWLRQRRYTEKTIVELTRLLACWTHWARDAGYGFDAIRAFLRFLIATGRCPPGRDRAMPPIARWRLASLPRFLPDDDIARVIAACDGERRLRDRAIVLLLVRLGMRAGEVARLRFAEIDWRQGHLRLRGKGRREEHIRQTKFNKDRLVPMHASVAAALDRYLRVRATVAGADDHVFLTVGGRPMGLGTVHGAFYTILNKAGIAPGRPRRPRVHDLRHTFATRALERCAMGRADVARDFVALSTYLGHGHIPHTYWYLEATPDLMGDIAAAAEALAAEVIA